ncbi:MAG: DUF3467 domain-containing protein [Pseudomonadota bacterium]
MPTGKKGADEQGANGESIPGGAGEVGKPALPTVNWDDSNMSTSYANVVNAASSREEVTLLFGTNQTWNAAGKEEFNVRLSDRIVLGPYAAKRLHILLGAILNEYERRFGELELDRIDPSGQGKKR